MACPLPSSTCCVGAVSQKKKKNGYPSGPLVVCVLTAPNVEAHCYRVISGMLAGP